MKATSFLRSFFLFVSLGAGTLSASHAFAFGETDDVSRFAANAGIYQLVKSTAPDECENAYAKIEVLVDTSSNTVTLQESDSQVGGPAQSLPIPASLKNDYSSPDLDGSSAYRIVVKGNSLMYQTKVRDLAHFDFFWQDGDKILTAVDASTIQVPYTPSTCTYRKAQ